MTIQKEQNGTSLTMKLGGKLDMAAAQKLEEELRTSLKGVTELIIDFQDLIYLTSAGIRVLMGAQREMERSGTMVIRNVGEEIMHIFEMTGLNEVFPIE